MFETPTEDPRHTRLTEASRSPDPQDLMVLRPLIDELLNENPQDVIATFYLGTLMLREEKWGEAVIYFDRCVQILPEMAEAWNNLGNALRELIRRDEADQAFRRAASLVEHADFLNNIASVNVNWGEPKEAEKWALRALDVDPAHREAHWNLALSYLEQGRFREGFELYPWGYRATGRPNRQYDAPSLPEVLRDPAFAMHREQAFTHVVVYGEQGIGDEILFASCIPDLMNDMQQWRFGGQHDHERGGLVIDCHPRLQRLFRQSFPEARVYPTRKMQMTPWFWDEVDERGPFTAKAALGDLAILYRRDAKDFPLIPDGYLQADPDEVEWARQVFEQLGDGPFIGISWAGGTPKTNRADRSIPLPLWLPFFEDMKGHCTFVSLQYTPEAEKHCERFHREFGIKIHHLPAFAQCDDYATTAAAVKALDGVVSANTSIVHLAGAMGVKTLTLTPHRAAWRYYDEDGELLWYRPNVRVIRQSRAAAASKLEHRWASVMAQAVKDAGFLFNPNDTAKKELA